MNDKIAVNSGEVHGINNGWESTRSTWKNEVQSGKLVMLLQHFPTRHPELSHVPLDIEFAKIEEAKKLLKVGAHSLGPTASSEGVESFVVCCSPTPPQDWIVRRLNCILRVFPKRFKKI